MKHLWKAGTVLALAAVMVCAGVFAATITSATHKSSSTVSFTSRNVYVDIVGESSLGTTQSYTGATYENFGATGAKATADAWEIGDITLNDEVFIATITFKFTNQGDAPATIGITLPTLDIETFDIVAKAVVITPSPEPATTTEVPSDVIIGFGESATFTYTITLIKFNKTIDQVPCNFDIVLTRAEEVQA